MPRTILALMNVEGLTRENVASHLQKYRAYLKKIAGLPPSAPLPPSALPVLQQVGPPVGYRTRAIHCTEAASQGCRLQLRCPHPCCGAAAGKSSDTAIDIAPILQRACTSCTSPRSRT